METALQRQATRAADDLSALLVRVAGRDKAAFAALYAATSAKLYGVILRILLRRDVADDLLQEVFIKIWERAVDYDASKGSPIAWMVAIARNRALDEVRRKRPVSIEDAPETMEIASDDPSPLDNLNQSQDRQRLNRCLDGLEPDRRDMVLLAYREGLSREELAERYARPVPTIKTWLRRSLAQLKDCLQQMNDREDIDGLAAEYALGTLDASERTAVAARRPARGRARCCHRRLGAPSGPHGRGRRRLSRLPPALFARIVLGLAAAVKKAANPARWSTWRSACAAGAPSPRPPPPWPPACWSCSAYADMGPGRRRPRQRCRRVPEGRRLTGLPAVRRPGDAHALLDPTGSLREKPADKTYQPRIATDRPAAPRSRSA